MQKGIILVTISYLTLLFTWIQGAKWHFGGNTIIEQGNHINKCQIISFMLWVLTNRLLHTYLITNSLAGQDVRQTCIIFLIWYLNDSQH